VSAPLTLDEPSATTPAGCPVCGSTATEPFLEVGGLPTHVGVLWADRASAQACARGDLRLAFCPRCGHIANTAFDPDSLDYEQEYDNSLHASAVFRDFEQELVRSLAHPRLRGGLVVEIGPGDGRFLTLLARAASCRGLGFEPGLARPSVELDDGRVELRGRLFAADAVVEPVGLVACRQVLEHIADPRALLDEVHAVLDRSPGSRAYVEVPNSDLFLRDLSIWDLVYEHCQYFVAASLRHLFEVAGFEVLRAWASYQGQFLSVEVAAGSQPVPAPAGAPAELVERVQRFAHQFAEKSAEWRHRLTSSAEQGRRTVVWGGGARAVSFVNTVAADGGIDFAVDINEAKHGTYLAGTGHEVRPPDALRDAPPDVVVVLNPIYLDEIRSQLRSMGLDPEVVTA
jgi:hypothetical protein